MKKEIIDNLLNIDTSLKAIRRDLWFRQYFKKN
jgi:hypothetical protein